MATKKSSSKAKGKSSSKRSLKDLTPKARQNKEVVGGLGKHMNRSWEYIKQQTL
jgi:hypothetical protein